MEHLLFAGYLTLFAWLITRIKFFTRSGLTPSLLIIFFLLKVIAGIFYGWIGVYYGNLAQMVDTWAFQAESIKEYNLLLSDPAEFVASLFRNSYGNDYGKFFGSHNSWWNDLHANIIIKLLAVFNVFSLGNYYINVIFYSFITFFGPIALFRVFIDVYKRNKIAILLATFLIPSFLYWTSGIHKDGIVFLGLTLIIYFTYYSLKQGKLSFAAVLNILIGLILILAIRNYILLNLLPALFAWVLAVRLKKNPILVFVSCYAVFIFLFFITPVILPAINLPAAVVEKQKAFLALQGGSAVAVNLLEPNFISFIQNAPHALALTLIRPYPSDVKHLLSLAASIEINILIFLFVLFLIARQKLVSAQPFIIFCVFFSLSLLLTVGYTVNFLGAIVRYRAIALPFLIIPVVANINWKKITSSLLYIKNNNV